MHVPKESALLFRALGRASTTKKTPPASTVAGTWRSRPCADLHVWHQFPLFSSPRLGMGFLFLVLHSHLRPSSSCLLLLQLAHTQLVHTQFAHTQLVHTQLAHTQLVHTQLAHTQLVHTQFAHTQLVHTQFAHTQLVHTQLAHTQLAHTQLLHTTCAHTTWHSPSLCVAGVALMALARFVPRWRRGRRGFLRGKRGTRRHGRASCVAGVALGDIDRHFASQAWHLWPRPFNFISHIPVLNSAGTALQVTALVAANLS